MKFSQRVRAKLALGFLLVALIPIFIIGIYTFYSVSNILREHELYKQSEKVKQLKKGIETFLATAQKDLIFLSKSYALQQYLEFPNSPESTRQAIEQEFLRFSQNRQIYYQICYLNELGEEIVRIDSDGVNSWKVAKSQFQNKQNRHYFTETMRLTGHQILVSTPENQVSGQLEIPQKPMIRYAINVYYPDGRKAGIVITHLPTHKFLQVLGTTLLVNPAGYYLHHPLPEKIWGSPLKTRYSLWQDYPTLAPTILSKTEGSLTTEQYALTFQRIPISHSESWTLIAIQSTLEIFSNVTSFRITFSLVLIMTLLITLFGSFLINRKIARPLEELMEIVKQVPIDEKITQLDELGLLKAGFNSLLKTIKAAETTLQQTHQEIEATHWAKIRFLANMGHELRTPLSAIIGYSEMLQEEMFEQGAWEVGEDIAKIHSAGKHLLRVVNDILDISKIEAGKMGIYLETFYLPNMINDIVEIAQTILTKSNKTLEVHYPTDLGEMHADLTKVRQILLNLLSNTAKLTKPKDLVSLAVSRQGEDWVIFKIRNHDHEIDAEQQKHLIEIFTQVNTSSPLKYGEMELGLAVTKHFVQMMGGNISLANHQGYLFTVQLPTKVMVPENISKVTPIMQTLEEGSVILVIDDDHTVLSILQKYLSTLGYQVEVIDNGEEGLRIARNLLPDVIILDVMMPKMDGWEVLTHLKADSQLARIPVIILSMIEDKSIGYSLGATDYLVKPITREQLTTILEKYHFSKDEMKQLIMVIDDDLTTLDMIARMLRKAGWRVCKAENARVAFDYLQKRSPNLILSDLHMPEMDSFEFITKLHKTYPSIPIIIITVDDLNSEEQLHLKEHYQVASILQKGAFTRDELIETVNKLLSSPPEVT